MPAEAFPVDSYNLYRKNKQDVPIQTVHDFTKGKHSHRRGVTAFICTKRGSPMSPMEKEGV